MARRIRTDVVWTELVLEHDNPSCSVCAAGCMWSGIGASVHTLRGQLAMW